MIEGFINVPGGKVYYRQYGELGEKAPLIAVHGGPGSCHDTLRALSPLADERAVILYDQLGCGASDKPTDDALWTLARYVEELGVVIEYFNTKTYHLLGHSFGASLVLDHALQQPSGLQSIVLSSPLVSVNHWRKDAHIRKQQLPADMQAIIEAHEAAGTTDSHAYKMATDAFDARFLCRLNPKPDSYLAARDKLNLHIYHLLWGPSEFHCSGQLADYERVAELATLRCPTLLLCGGHDEVREETLKIYHNNIPDATYHVFANSAHVAYLEETDAYLEVVKQFHLHKESCAHDG